MLQLLEFEEGIGKLWHRLVGETASYRRHPEHAVALDEVRPALAVFFRGLGGEAAVRIAGTTAAASGHRLGLRQRLGLGEERLERASRDGATLFLPPRLDLFPDADLNRRLYYWLAAFFARLPCRTSLPADPLRRDLLHLRDARRATAAVLSDFPGLRRHHASLCAGLRDLRPRRSLPPVETAVEGAVLALLGGEPPDHPVWAVVTGAAPLNSVQAPPGYKPFLPVPLWGEALEPPPSAPRGEDERAEGAGEDAEDGRRRKGRRSPTDEADRTDPLVLNRFEKIQALAEMININRAADDDEDEDARKAADDMDEVAVGKHHAKPATRLKFDLDLPPEAVDPAGVVGEVTYPEWDYTVRTYRSGHCRVLAGTAAEEGEAWRPDAAAARRIRLIRRQFEALRPKHEVLRGQADGPELDLEALVRARADLAAGGVGSDRVHLALRRQTRDLAAALLVDVSLSTDSWVANRRVLDVEKEALTVLTHGIAACGDDHAIYTFTSRKRDWVRIEAVKEFDEPFSERVTRRIAALKPGFYTRIGTAIRHAAARLAERPNRYRLLIVLTDGKPNDVDYYEGRYGIEDTRKAVQEARRVGIAVFGVTVDKEAKAYFPTLFGRGGYAIVGDVARLPAALPAIYRHLAG